MGCRRPSLQALGCVLSPHSSFSRRMRDKQHTYHRAIVCGGPGDGGEDVDAARRSKPWSHRRRQTFLDTASGAFSSSISVLDYYLAEAGADAPDKLPIS